MRNFMVRFVVRLVFPAVLALTAFPLGARQAVTRARREGPAPPQFLLRRTIPGTRDLQLIVELTQPSVVRAMSAATVSGATVQSAGARNRINLNSTQALSYRAQVARAQREMTDRLQALKGVVVQGSTDLVMNSMIVRAPVEQYFAIRSLPGVRKVYFSRPQKTNLNTSAVLLNAPALWVRAGGQANAGSGMKIGIIDTGIDITNPMFVDTTTPFPSGFPKGESAHYNHKVIVARNYVSLLSNPDPNHTAVDQVGHGTFVAGCAAGKQYAAPLATISGMAPGAFLGNYKVFGTPGTNDSTTTAAILAAINAAVGDGMDVLNLSLGDLDYVPPSEDPEVDAIDAAVAAGTVVVIAAGNSGPGTHTIETPGSSPVALGVGAATNSRTFGAQLHVTGPAPVPPGLQSVVYLPGTGPAITSPIASTSVTDVSQLDGDGLACSALPAGSLSGKIVLIERGDCTFLVKVTNAASAGARAVTVYNNVPGGGAITMGGLVSTSTPAVMVSNTDGLAIKSFLTANPSATMSIDVSTSLTATPTTPDIVADYSSRGPSADYGLKPDLLAVGTNVYSATQNTYSSGELYDPSHFTLADGTSFSTAMVSGAAAAVKQLLPSLTAAGLKSALVNTANRNVTTDGTNPADILQAGGGLLDMGQASAAGAVFAPTVLDFGVHSYSGSISLTQTVVITNLSASADQFELTVQPVVSGPQLSLSRTNTDLLAPGASVSVDVTIEVQAPLTGGFQGYVKVASTQTSSTYAVPYWAGIYVPDSTRVLSVSQDIGLQNAFRNLSDAIAAAQPGNIIEIADSQTYSLGSSGLVISTNAQGLPLHGLTIRAASGQTPVLDGTSTAALNDIQIVGVQNVLLHGLTITGGETGVDILQPSASVPASVTIDHCNITNMTASSTSSGVFAENGGGVDVTYSTVSGSSSTGIVVSGGTHLTLSNSTVVNNGSDGVDALDSQVQMINSNLSSNLGPGAYLVNCSGTLTGNTIQGNTTSSSVGFVNYGDGVQVVDGTLTAEGNTVDSNDGAGFWFAGSTSASPGPAMIFRRNILRANGEYGVLADQAQSLQSQGNLYEDNAQGLQVNGSTAGVLTNEIVVRSTDSAFGDGINLAGTSSIRIVNSTLYQNRQGGIVQTGSSAVSVANAIVGSNAGGDLRGLQSGEIQFSLIGDGTFASSNNNITGDPKFVNPAGDDFSLGAGSPALDAGSNSAASLPFLDFDGRLRIAAAGTAPGEGKVDLGALETGSTYPLVYPVLINGNNPVIGDSFTTGFAALNPSSAASATALFTAYGPTGSLLAGQTNPATQSFAPEAQLPILGFQLFGFPFESAELGAVMSSSIQKLAGFFLIFDQNFSRLADGVDVSSETGTTLLFMRHEFNAAGKATYWLFNPGVNPANITATLITSAGGSEDTPKQAVIPPKGQYSFAFDAVAASSGYVRVQSDRPVSGLEIYGNTSEIATLRPVIPGTEARLFFPHIAVNGGYSSLIGVVNTSSFPANLTLTAYGNDGEAIAPSATRSLSANGQLLEPASSLFGLGAGSLTTGYVVVDSDQPGISGFCDFAFDDGSVQSEAAVPGESIPQTKLFFSHIAHQVPAGSGGNYQTGIALLNPFGTPISYTMRVFDGDGRTEVAEMTDVLGPRAKVAKLLSNPAAGAGFFTQSISLGRGHIEVTSDYPLLGFELFFTERLTQLAAVMAQSGE